MNISDINGMASLAASQLPQSAAGRAGDLQAAADKAQQKGKPDPQLRETFDQFVGQTFYSQLLSAMRHTVGKPAYFHGGRAEEVFQNQLDQVLSEELTEANAETFTGPMFELFNLSRS